MNNDLISREALKKSLNLIYDCAYIDSKSKEGIASDIIATIDNAPTVEPERPQGDNKETLFVLNHLFYNCDNMTHKEYDILREAIVKGKWGKWIISEIQCPNCLEYFQTDCYSMGELDKCPNCGADMRKGGAEE